MHTKIIEDPATDLYIHNFRIQITFGVNIIIQALQGSYTISPKAHIASSLTANYSMQNGGELLDAHSTKMWLCTETEAPTVCM